MDGRYNQFKEMGTMATLYRFDCYKSILGGWVASGTVRGRAGGSFEERPVWFGCQADSWPDLQVGMARLVEVLSPRIETNPRTTPIEVFIKAWPDDKPILLPPVGKVEKLFANLINVGSRRRGFLENADDVQIVSFLKIGALAMFRPEGDWKPELVASFLGFTLNLVPEHPIPAPERAGQTREDLIEETLLAGLDEPRS
jgi:hypothetical protein